MKNTKTLTCRADKLFVINRKVKAWLKLYCRCREGIYTGQRSARGPHATQPTSSAPSKHIYPRLIIRSDMKNLAYLLAVPISELVVPFISLVAAATLLSCTTEGRSARTWSAGDRGRRECRRARFPHHTHPPIHC
ncbi:unnamed protein product [Parnassius apollo]|uniref:(apollo) hypothetical protein n=1 Tax=Parnassius apollo TaxID=110799 RepID=A0A8S3WKH3_PARAO|nr:unnamed protein product [Parnassius apollo]